jgi:hypothetical protein
MADEKPQSSSSDKARGSKRRYFRRNRKGKKSDSRAEQSPEVTAEKPGEGAVSGAAEKKGPPRKKRRPRSRRSGSRQRSQVETTQTQEQEPEREYEEPTSVYVYTYVVRPDYRDMVSDYRSEPHFQQSEENEQITSSTMERLQEEINAQLDDHFLRASAPARPKVTSYDEFADDEDQDDEDLDDEDLYGDDLDQADLLDENSTGSNPSTG